MRYHAKALALILVSVAVFACECRSKSPAPPQTPAETQAAAETQSQPQSQPEEQRTFDSPEAAVAALKEAIQQEDKDELHRIFGPDVEELKSGDPDQDREDAARFARRLESGTKIQQDGPDHATLLIGQEQWPFAVPLVKEGSQWLFDTDEGLEELTNRRIGRNELQVIAALQTIIAAQAEFFDRDPDGLGVKHYARRMVSEEGKKNGLYWPSPGGVDPSPIGPVLAAAATRRDEQGQKVPYYGYLFKMLYSQAASAPNGAMDYLQDGHLTRGWAGIAYPAEYGVTGVMSFLVSNAGKVYQKDLGADTDSAVEQIEAFDPADGWQTVGS